MAVKVCDLVNALKKLPLNAVVGTKIHTSPANLTVPVLNAGPVRDSSGVEVTAPYEKLEVHKHVSGSIGIWIFNAQGLGTVTVDRLISELEKEPGDLTVGLVSTASPAALISIYNTIEFPMATLDPCPHQNGKEQVVLWF